jgi:transposase-like protein
MSKVIRKQYSEEFKLSVIRDYYSSGMSKSACIRKYGLSGDAILLLWLRKYESEKKLLPLQLELTEEEMANRSKEDYKKEIAELKKRNRDLEKALQFSRLETLARDLMIDKAEEYFDVPIRKKSGAKQP